jgi:hypothetical protein
VRYPGVLRDEVKGMRVVDRTGRYALIKVDREAPFDDGAGDAGGDGEAQ